VGFGFSCLSLAVSHCLSNVGLGNPTVVLSQLPCAVIRVCAQILRLCLNVVISDSSRSSSRGCPWIVIVQINYVYILQSDSDHALRPSQVLTVAAVLSVLVCLSISFGMSWQVIDVESVSG
jgi:hypothetical protein